MNSLISVVVPIYNVSTYIGDCLESLYAQTYDDIEIVLVNDASLDDSMVVAQPYIKKLQSKYIVKIVNHEINRGLSAARNSGMDVSSGDWIYFLDSDDIITPNCLEEMYLPTQNYPDVDFVIGEIGVVGAKWTYPLDTPSYVCGNQYILNYYIKNKWYVMAVNKLYRRKFLEVKTIIFKEGILHEDELYSFLIANCANSMITVHSVTYIYQVRPTGSIMSQRSAKSFQSWLLVLNEIFKIISLQYEKGDSRIPLSYCVNHAYRYVAMVLDSNILTSEEKNHLSIQMKHCTKNLVKDYNRLPMKESLRYYMLLLPTSLFRIFLHLRYFLHKYLLM